MARRAAKTQRFQVTKTIWQMAPVSRMYTPPPPPNFTKPISCAFLEQERIY